MTQLIGETEEYFIYFPFSNRQAIDAWTAEMDSWEGHWQRFLYGTYYAKNKGRVDSGFLGHNVGNWSNTAVDVQFGQHMDHIPDVFEYTITGPGTYTIAMTGNNHYHGTVTKTFTVLTDAFADVNIKTPHTKDITWMYLNKISEGRLEKDGIRTYRPMNSVVRQDMAAFLRRLQAMKNPDAQSPSSGTDQPGFEAVMLDVGQGLSVFVKADRHAMLFDGGGRSHSSYVVSWLRQHGITSLDYVIASHYNEDHIAGLVGVLHTTQVNSLLCQDTASDTDIYHSFIEVSQNVNTVHP